MRNRHFHERYCIFISVWDSYNITATQGGTTQPNPWVDTLYFHPRPTPSATTYKTKIRELTFLGVNCGSNNKRAHSWGCFFGKQLFLQKNNKFLNADISKLPIVFFLIICVLQCYQLRYRTLYFHIDPLHGSATSNHFKLQRSGSWRF